MDDVLVRRFADLGARTWHDLVRLRIDVFVVEQQCPYPELDGRDVESATLHLYVVRSGAPSAYARLLGDGESARLGRVCVATGHRGDGLAATVVRRALAEAGQRPVVADAQAHLAGWYAELGFEVTGPEFLDDGIPHVPMRRAPYTE